jgi:hypothetical protein
MEVKSMKPPGQQPASHAGVINLLDNLLIPGIDNRLIP